MTFTADRRLRRLGLGAVLALWGAAARAGDFNPALPPELKLGFAILSRTAGRAPAAAGPALRCDPKVSRRMCGIVEGDLAFLRSVWGKSSSDLQKSVFGPLAGSVYLAWLAARVKTVGVDYRVADAVAYTQPPLYPEKILLTRAYASAAHPQIARISVLLHEARHMEVKGRYWSHVRCPVPFRDARGEDMLSFWTGENLSGQPACDRTAVGAYGIEVIMLRNVSRYCLTCGGKVRMDADLYARDAFNRIIDSAAVETLRRDVY
ncbi:MAG: hypothetical protein PHF00_01870 [Elusimicrobia bacterium]|nr:hypothetical protein [Elusimicrobiota bacterium]